MSSSDESVLAVVNLININKNRSKRRHWIHPYWKHRQSYGGFNVFRELHKYPEKFQCFYRMKEETFQLLFTKLRPAISKKDTNYRRAVPPEERLLITLR